MRTQSLLVRFPSFPVNINALMPDRCMATLAACLQQDDHIVRIHDYVNLDFLIGLDADDRQCTKSDTQNDIISRALTQWRVHAQHKKFNAALKERAREVANTIASQEILDFVLIGLAGQSDSAPSLDLARLLHLQRKDLPLFCHVSESFQKPESLLKNFDCVCIGECEETIVQLANTISAREQWRTIPNILFKGTDKKIVITDRNVVKQINHLPIPAYDVETYPALEGDGKLKVFEIEDARKAETEGDTRLRSTRLIVSEIEDVLRKHGAHAFSFTSDTPGQHILAVTKTIMEHNFDISYSRTATAESLDSSIYTLLRDSGCCALCIDIGSGSQYMIDRYFKKDFTVTHAENLLRASRLAGIFTVARFTYPTPLDDHHTKAETLRMATRCMPDSVKIAPPAPGTLTRPAAADLMDIKETRSPKVIEIERRCLMDEINELGVPDGFPIELAILARASSARGCENNYAQSLLSNDSGWIDSLDQAICQFNQNNAKINTIDFASFPDEDESPRDRLVGN